MVTNKGASANLECKSTDVKPTTGVDVNTKIHELDTDKWYYFTGETWAEIPSSGGGFTPTETQLASMNSGITSADVEQINTNKTNISNIQTSLSSTSSDVGKVLTADGEGGYAWQPASGGGTAKYLYQFYMVINSNAPNSKTRFSGVLLSDNPNLQLDGSLPNRTAVLEYLKFNRKFTPDYDYYTIVNINTITVNNNSSSNTDFVPVSYARYKRSTNQLILQTATEEKAILILDNDSANTINAAITAL